MNKRDLKADLELCNKATANAWYWSDGDPIVVGTDKWEPILWIQRRPEPRADDITFLCNAREGWPYAIEQALAERRKVMEKDVIMGAMQQAYADQKKRIEFAMEIIRKTGETAQKVRSFDAETVLQVLSSLEEVLENG